MSVAPEDYLSAEEFCNLMSPDDDMGCGNENLYHAMREYAKYHVKHALKQAYYKLSTRDIKGSIENAYPDENIR